MPAAGHVILVGCHHSVLPIIRAVLLYVVVLWVFLLSKYTIFKPPGSFGIAIAMDWLVQHPTDQCTHAPKVQEIHLFMRACFFCLIYAYFQRITLPSSLPLVPHIRGHTARTPLPSPLPSACLRFNREKKKMFRIKFPSLASPCVELVCIYSTYQNSTKHASCEALSAVSFYTDTFVSGLDIDQNEYTRHTFW